MEAWIPNPVDIENFLNPMDEVVEDDLDAIDDIVLSEFLPEVDEDEIMEEQAQVLHHEAIQALKTLCIYEEQQEQGETQLISALHRHERLLEARELEARELEARELEGRKQRDIRAFFGA
ncbi:hypothetical protein N7471_000721 [Penicillium samsonianum]|uniref:uncharacterized protein n=1 Tax=Penicillium samsonianum TaxID=1882272 RepID=UPI0025473011|nr:uncharacterized protein N7471_000721 [Penicillium samsonianum]KAJ6149522.1 hypothetical protein N7471_000721 [Penicillium samsonianum]